MSYIWFYVHWLAEHVRKSSICQINRLAGLTVRNPGEEANIIFKLLFQYRLPVLIKKSTIQHTKWAKMTYILFWVHWLAGHALKLVKHRSTKFGRLTRRDHREGAKIILQVLFLTRRRVTIKNQTALPHREHWRKWLIFDSGCTGWQSTPPRYVIMVGWLQETLD